MFCCCNCFDDSEIKDIILNNKTEIKAVQKKCDFCGSEGVALYDINADENISWMINELIDCFKPISSLPKGFPQEKTNQLANMLQNEWHIFSKRLDQKNANKLLKALCSEQFNQSPSLFNEPVGIAETNNAKYLEKNSVLRNLSWDEFLQGIKTITRFHGDYINKEIMNLFLPCARKKHKKGEVFFRARICKNKEGYKKEEMGAPPIECAKAGRINPEGIRVLYLSNSVDTTLYEVRAGIYDFVAVGTFVLSEDIEVIDLASINEISPFIHDTYGFDYIQYAVNIKALEQIGNEIAKPIRNDNRLDYLPTQYFCDYIKAKGYDGIEYHSTMCENGVNLAVFDDRNLVCEDVKVYDIKTIDYSFCDV